MLCDRCHEPMRALEGGRGQLCYSCGHLVADDGAELGIGASLTERLELVQAAAKGVVGDVGGVVIDTAKDVDQALKGPMERALERVFGKGGNDDR